MVLQAFIDDSGSEPQGKVFVLAGFIASAERWAEFSCSWQRVLDRNRLEYFKHSEAMTLNGEFDKRRGWNAEKRDALLAELVDIICAYAEYQTYVSMRHAHFEKYLRPIPAPERTLGTDAPYLTLYMQIIAGLALLAERFKIKEKCDFIFDEQGGFSVEADAKWPSIEKVHSGETRAWNKPDILGARPTFQNDKDFLPLQAADFYAGEIRRNLSVSEKIIVPARSLLIRLNSIPGETMTMSEQKVRNLAREFTRAAEEWFKENPDFAKQTYDERLSQRQRRKMRGVVIRKKPSV